MAFQPQTMFWKGKRAVLLVHGIGDASTGKDGALPIDVLKDALGDDARDIALYRLNYDFINDWLATKIQFAAGITAFKQALKLEFGDNDSDGTISEYAGDVLWPVLSVSIRLAVRDAFIAQLEQIHIDRGESALARGDDPLDYQISVISHSLGCFHTYEALTAIAEEPSHELRPASDLFTFDSVFLMASPVQLIRTAANLLGPLIPDTATLATVANPLAIPGEVRRGKRVPCTSDFISVTGTHDPIGGHLLGKRFDWAFMDMPGQQTIIVPQHALDIDTKAGTAKALAHAFAKGGPKPNDPHSWANYITAQSRTLRGVVLT